MAGRKNKKKFGTVPQIFSYIVILLIAVVTYNTANPFSDDIPNWYTLTGQELPDENEDLLLSDIPLNEYAQTIESFDASVHVIDVGQGNCTLIIADGESMLIDAGDNGTQDIVLEYLTQMGIEKLDYVVATHPHADHIGSMDDVLENFEVENLIMPEIPEKIIPTSKTYERFLDAIDTSKTNVIKAAPNTDFVLGNAKFYILSPIGEYDDLNNMSAAVRFVHEESEFLVAADIEAEAEEDILASGQNIDSDVLVLGHHGSSTSSTEEFLKAVDAEIYVAQVGYDNEFGHPHEEVYDAIMELGGKLLRSDVDGHIIFGVNEDGMTLITQK